ncbi:MAG: hypothetical protein Q7R50_01760 [Dehalococcoidales bacterium]|nr:hypothetical protein [Dehalococcoidales bacterium]
MTTSTGHLVKVGIIALVAIIGFDLFLHAGILAFLYSKPSPFLLSPEEAFRRIPLGYLSFVLLIALLVWLMSRIGVRGCKSGFAFGLAVGSAVWGAETLGLFSISTASPGLLLGWFLGQSLELGIAGMVIGSGLETKRLRPLLIKVIVFFMITAILAIVLQNVTN